MGWILEYMAMIFLNICIILKFLKRSCFGEAVVSHVGGSPDWVEEPIRILVKEKEKEKIPSLTRTNSSSRLQIGSPADTGYSLHSQIVSDPKNVTQLHSSNDLKPKIDCDLAEPKINFYKQIEDNKKQQDIEAKLRRKEKNELKRRDNERNAEKAAQKLEEQLEELQELEKENEDYEKETVEIAEKEINEVHACNIVYVICALLSQRFDAEEDKISEWLKSVRNPIISTKNRYSSFEKTMRSVSRKSKNYGEMLKSELTALHTYTLTAYDKVYDGYLESKNILEEFPNNCFSKILQQYMAVTCNKLYSILEEIDERRMIENSNLDALKHLFCAIDGTDVPSTEKLRKESKDPKWGEDPLMVEPLVYPNSTLKIKEIDS